MLCYVVGLTKCFQLLNGLENTDWQEVNWGALDEGSYVISVNNNTGEISLTTDNIPEANNKLYYNVERFVEAAQTINLDTFKDVEYDLTLSQDNILSWDETKAKWVPRSAILSIEQIDDRVGQYIQTGTGLTKNYDDINNTLFLNPHQVVGGDNISVTYNNNLRIIEIDYVPSAELNPSYLLNRINHTGTQPAATITGLATVATSGSYNDLSSRPNLGTGAFKEAGTLANQVLLLSENSKLPALDGSNLINVGLGGSVYNTSNFDNQPPNYYLNRSNHTGTQSVTTITGLGSAATKTAGSLSGNVLLINEDNKLPPLDGSNLTNIISTVSDAANLAGESPSFYLNRANHTGTQSVNTITGLATVSTTGNYNDLSNRPSLGSAATKTAGTLAGNVLLISEDNKLPALDGSNLTNIISTVSNAANLGGELPSYYLSRSNHTGTQPHTTITGLGDAATRNAGTSAGQVLLLSENNKLPIMDGSNLTNVLATVGDYNDLINKPVLGTSAQYDVGTQAGNILRFTTANTLPALDGSNLTGIIANNSELLGGELPSYFLNRAHHLGTQSHTSISGLGNSATKNAGMNAGEVLLLSENNKLPSMDGSLLTNVVASSSNAQTVGGFDTAYLLNRANHTGTQTAATITGLATVATTGSYNDLTNKPTLGSAASKDTGTLTGQVLVFSLDNKLPALDGSLLTNIVVSSGNADTLNNLDSTHFLNRANHTGTQTLATISDAGTSASRNAGTGAGEVLLLSEGSKLPALDGSLLTNLPSSSGVYIPPTGVAVSTNITLDNTYQNDWILASGNITITAPVTSFGTFYCTVQNVGTGVITIAGVSNNQSNLIIRQWQHCVIYSDGVNWYATNNSLDQTLVKSVNTNYTLLNSDYKYWIKASNSITITVQSNPFTFFEAIIQNVGTGTITLSGITNAEGTKLATQWKPCHVYYDGSSWTAVGGLVV
jgi:hypothetical protein